MSEAALSDSDRATLSAVLDTLIPAREDGSLPGAGGLGLAAAIEEALRGSPELRPAVVQGLAALEAEAAFAAQAPEARRETLEALGATQPAFVPALVFHLYAAYYRDPRVLEALGVPARAPHPLGYELEAGDLGVLDGVRKRAPMYREP